MVKRRTGTIYKNHLEHAGTRQTWCGRDMRRGGMVTTRACDAALYQKGTCKACIHAYRKAGR